MDLPSDVKVLKSPSTDKPSLEKSFVFQARTFFKFKEFTEVQLSLTPKLQQCQTD